MLSVCARQQKLTVVQRVWRREQRGGGGFASRQRPLLERERPRYRYEPTSVTCAIRRVKPAGRSAPRWNISMQRPSPNNKIRCACRALAAIHSRPIVASRSQLLVTPIHGFMAHTRHHSSASPPAVSPPTSKMTPLLECGEAVVNMRAAKLFCNRLRTDASLQPL